MKYITGKQALSLPCSLETCGDYKVYIPDWDKLYMLESDDSIFKDYGIEKCNCVPDNPGEYKIANTLRALLDLLAEDKMIYAQGAREEFIGNEKYTEEFMSKVLLLKDIEHWDKIDQFMGKEYTIDWLDFKEANHIRYEKTIMENDEKYTEIQDINEKLAYAIVWIFGRMNIQDVYMIVEIYKNHIDEVSHGIMLQLKYALQYRDINYINYLVRTQENKSINNEKLVSDFIEMCQKLQVK
ncbi:MAG: hypothetical protein HDR05_12510 [Lachnospiraceae bacterium]|nr:hypothetical protein [Lachnospiraceae bacterium]